MWLKDGSHQSKVVRWNESRCCSVGDEMMALIKAAARALMVTFIAESLAVAGQDPTRQEAPGAKTAPAVKTVEVTPARVEGQVGQQIKFTAVARDAEGKPVDVNQILWFAGPFDLAAVDDTGNVTLYGPGEVEVGAMVKSTVARAKIIVKPQPVVAVEIASMTGPLAVGATMQLTPTTRVANGNPRQDVTYSWSSSNPSVTAVNKTGLVTAIGAGRAVIKVTCEGIDKSVQVDVENIRIQSLRVEPRSTSARTGDVVHFKAIATGAKNAPVRWTLSG